MTYYGGTADTKKLVPFLTAALEEQRKDESLFDERIKEAEKEAKENSDYWKPDRRTHKVKADYLEDLLKRLEADRHDDEALQSIAYNEIEWLSGLLHAIARSV